MKLLGYNRIPAGSDAHVQLDALMEAGVERDDVYSDVTLGTLKQSERPGMCLLLAAAEPGDTVVVWRIDRLGRSLGEVLETVTLLGDRGINLRSLQDAIDPSSAHGLLMQNFLGTLAELSMTGT